VDQTWVKRPRHPQHVRLGHATDVPPAAGTLHEGENVVVVNVLSTWDAGGLLGPPDALAVAFEDGTKVSLADQWRYRAVPLAMGRAPRAPWEPISGLTTLYNAMIAPIGPYGVRAVAWYQARPMRTTRPDTRSCWAG